MQDFALSLYVLKITGSGTKFASVLVVTLIPQLLLGPFMGVFADRFDRKKIIIILNFMSGITVGITAIMFKVNGTLSLPYIYGLVIILSLISLLFSPAIGAILHSIVKKEELLDANSVKTAIYSVGSIIAPLLAGPIFGLYGLAIIFVALIINFAMSTLCEIGFPYIVKNLFKCNDFQYGTFQAILLSGMVIAPFICTSLFKNLSFEKVISRNTIIVGGVIAIVAVIVSPLYTSLFKSSFVPYITLALLSIIIVIFMTAMPIGQMLFGVLLDTVPVYLVVFAASLVLVFSSFVYRKLTYIEDKNIDAVAQ